MTTPKLTTIAACRVAQIDRDRFNEHVAADHYPCAPETIPGRARLFDPDDMIGLWIFRQLMDDGLNARYAGRIACAVSGAARAHPDAAAISYVENWNGGRAAIPADHVVSPGEWLPMEAGTSPRKVTTFGIARLRKLLADLTEEERAIIGERD